jgi:hypothetical protein
MNVEQFTVRHFIVYWMLTWAQVVAVIVIWEFEKWLWRLARGKSPLTKDPEDDKLDRK